MKKGILYLVVFFGACTSINIPLLPEVCKQENKGKEKTYNNPMHRRTANTPSNRLKPLLNIHHQRPLILQWGDINPVTAFIKDL